MFGVLLMKVFSTANSVLKIGDISIFTGDSFPSSSIGKKGDLFIRTDEPFLYSKTDSSDWKTINATLENIGIKILGIKNDISELPIIANPGEAYVIIDNLFVWNGDQWIDIGLIRGVRGFTGSQGDTGFIGSFGFTGSQGDIGFTGSFGFTGSQGDTGFVGSQGDIGFTGSQGDIGFTGSQGDTGFVGSQGDIGFTGSQGDIGFTGSQGDTGFVGSQGDIGFTGSQGDIGFTGSQGDTGFTGSQGDIGFTGSQGDIGFTGSQGDTGFVGSQGDIGFTGSQGDIGFTGSQGDTGFVGSQGDIGFTGSQGDIGFTGSQGDTGFTGSQGDIGFTGSQGDIGFTGSQGDTGFTGSQGDTGFVGSQGDIGFTGSQGDIGFTGSFGFTGSQGEDGVDGLDVSNMVGYAVTNTLASGFTAPSTSGLHYLISSIHVTNISTTEGWITAEQSLSGGTAIQIANQIPVPAGSSIELIKRFKVLNPSDILNFQANANSVIHVTISYFIDNSGEYFRSGLDVTDTISDAFVSSNTNGSYVESCLAVTDSGIDEKVTVTWTNGSNAIQGYFAYELVIPANGSVELLEKPKFIANGFKIRAVASASNSIELLISGRNR